MRVYIELAVVLIVVSLIGIIAFCAFGFWSVAITAPLSLVAGVALAANQNSRSIF